MLYRIMFILSVAILSCLPATAQTPIPIGSRLELFVDDYLVDSLSGNAVLDLKKPEPREVVLVTDAPSEGNVCAYYTVFQDGPLYRMYYRGWHYEGGSPTHAEVTCYAESTDGINWTKPNLGIFEFEGTTDNNIVWMDPGSHNFTPFLDTNPGAAPDAKYKALTRNAVAGGANGLYALKSADAVNWTLMSRQPVITEGAFDSQNLAYWDNERGYYTDYHRDFRSGVRDIKNAVSNDFLNWSNPDWLSYTPGTPTEHLYTNAIRPYERAPHILLGFPTRYYPSTSQVEPILMSSRDGTTFDRWDDALIPTTAPEDRDGNRSNYMAWGMLQLPDSERELSMYASEAYYEGPDSRLRRFTYRVDGFVSVNSTAGVGQLLTKPLVFQGDTMHVNFATFDQGTIRAELQDAAGNPIPGFTLGDFQPLSGDEIDQVLSWSGGSDVGQLAGTPVRILYELENADVYSFQFTGPMRPTIGRVFFKDDFESAPAVADGAFPDIASGDCDPVAQVGSWTVTGTNGGDEDMPHLAQVTNYGTPGAQEGDNYLRTGWDGQAHARGYLDGGPATDNLSVSLWFHASPDRTNDGRLILYDDEDVALAFIRMGEQDVVGGESGQLSWRDDGTWRNSFIDGGYEPNQWHHLQVDVNWALEQYIISLDEELLGSSTFSTTNAGNLEYIVLNGWSSGSTPAMFDDVMVHVPGVLLGDANLDGAVDVSDLGILATNYGVTSGAEWGDADFTGDGAVDVSDLGVLATNYGTGTAAVPEPTMLGMLLCLGCMALPWRRRR